ncbi:MAG: tetratricopeptide repeat protein [Flavobacteriaceae bacterium]|nr:tetratricopeptide repeat protein [Flavobacteriaceae bacterium]
MKINVATYFFLFVLLVSPYICAQNETSFNLGKEAYKTENYQEAISQWQEILNAGEHSAELYFNLGNAHYKLNNIGPSIYYYEKALQLDPYDLDIQNNLAFAENARVDAIEPLPQNVFKTWYRSVSGVFNYNGWAINAAIFSFIFVLLFLLYYYSASERKKRILFAASIATLFFLVASITLAFMTYSDYQKNNPAIIYSEKVEVKDAPSVGGEVTFVIHEGTKVQLLERDDEWVRIRLEDGKDGWVPLTDLKEL